MDTATSYSWVPYYEKLANALLPYADKRQELIQKLWAAFNERGIRPPTWNQDKTMPSDVDPFSVFCSFNKFKMTDANRMKYASAVAEVLGIMDTLPKGFQGLSLKDARKQAFYGWHALSKDSKDIGNLWDLFKAALKYADEGGSSDDFCRTYDQALTQYAVSWSITMGLFWIRPMNYVSLDSTNITYLQQLDGLKEKLPDFKHVPSGSVYLDICRNCKDWAAHNGDGLETLPEISTAAWKYLHEHKTNKPTKVKGTSPDDEIVIIGGERTEGESKKYTKEDFLRDVYISEEKYAQTVAALEYKYNIILQGPPGVGKSYAAKRLAYSLMGERDDSRICKIQFHHSYSYEDFMQGYRPDKDGKFTLRNGIFYDFCEKAKGQPDKVHYLIIDEINRGDLNKIFGETFLLMEKDKRGTENVKLAYSQETFTIPANIRIIGMMNTADRSIALIDHALRRRFAFIDLEPAYNEQKFKDFVQNAPSAKLQSLMEAIRALNEEITKDSSLGMGYRVGHSYFCVTNPTDLTDERLKTIVNFELVPLLEEYWFDEPDKVEGWSTKLKDLT